MIRSEIRAARTRVLRTSGFALSTLFVLAASAAAENRVGGHFGAVFPLLERAQGKTTTIDEDFKVGFPMGITVKKTDKLAFDLELVPVLDFNDKGPLGVPLTVHPGILRNLGGSWTAGLRVAFDIGGASWGFTPLLNRGFGSGDHSYFVELVAPVRFRDDAGGKTHPAIGLAVHVGIGF